MSELNELYQQLILEHNKSPRNFKKIEHASHYAEGFNPLCGDHYEVWLTLDGDRIADIGFQGSGCAISKSSASMMTTSVKGSTVAEAERLFEKFHQVVTGKWSVDENIEELGCLGALTGVAEFPSRIKCATLAWHALHDALKNSHAAVSTEVLTKKGENINGQ
ncbi:MAG: SUF system NifU family Fe-S cluster assembly protein [Bacteroidota bacterium]|jgi:nitrogen fixation NifU-like protein